MEKIISVMYGFLADILILVAGIPSGITSEGTGLLFLMAVILGIVSLVLLFLAVGFNDGYNLFVKLAVGGTLVWITAHCAVMKILNMDVLQTVPLYGSTAAGLFFAGAIAFLVVNFLLDFGKGRVTLLLWLGEFLFACSVIRLWGYIEVTESTPQYEKIMLVSGLQDSLAEFFEKLGLSALTGIFEYVLLIVLMFIIAYYLFRTRSFIPGEWMGGVVSQILSAAAYLIFESHAGIVWRTDQAFLVFFLFCAGEMLYLFIFCYEVKRKDQEGCIGAFFIGLSGILLHCVVVIAVDMTRRGAMGKTITRLSSGMTWIYEKIPFGMHTNFSEGNSFIAVIGVAIAIVLAVIILVILHMILGKVIGYEEEGAGMGATWFRNCSMVLIIPVVICWICSMYGNIFGDSYEWISLALQSLVSIGSALVVSNIAPALSSGFLGQLKLIAVSLAGSLISVCLLVPAFLALI